VAHASFIGTGRRLVSPHIPRINHTGLRATPGVVNRGQGYWYTARAAGPTTECFELREAWLPVAGSGPSRARGPVKEEFEMKAIADRI